MSKKDIEQKLALEEITEMKLDFFLLTSPSIKVNKNTFAIITYHYIVEWTETQLDFIKFYSIINNNFAFVGQYNFDSKIIKEPSDFVEMKAEKDNIIIITKNYLIIEKIIINNDGQYSFKNIILKELSEIPFKILNDGKFVSFHNNILKIYHYSTDTRDIKCVLDINYEKALENLSKKWEKKDDDVSQEISIDESEERGSSLADIIEIKEKKLIIISFSDCKYSFGNDIDYTKCKYLISIIDTNDYKIISNLIDLIEAEKLFYFGNDVLFSFGFRKFFKLNLKFCQKKLMLNENYIESCHHYYHYNIIPFLKENILVSFGYFRYGYYHNREEYKHCCIFDMKNNKLNELDISCIHYSNYDVSYFPLKIDDDKILFVFEDSAKLFKFNANNLNLKNDQKEENKRNDPKLHGIFEIFGNIFKNFKEENEKKKISTKNRIKNKSRSRSRNRRKEKYKTKSLQKKKYKNKKLKK